MKSSGRAVLSTFIVFVAFCLGVAVGVVVEPLSAETPNVIRDPNDTVTFSDPNGWVFTIPTEELYKYNPIPGPRPQILGRDDPNMDPACNPPKWYMSICPNNYYDEKGYIWIPMVKR